MQIFDLKSLDTAPQADKGITIDIRHPETNEKLPLKVTILGADSAAYQRVVDASLNAVFKEIARGKKTARTAADVREEKIDAICECVAGWQGFAEDGNVLDCNKENKKAIFGHRGYGWLLDQVDEQIRDRANFLPK